MGMAKKIVNINELLSEGGNAFVNVNGKVSSPIQIQKRSTKVVVWCHITSFS
jgi:hypothetical protein